MPRPPNRRTSPTCGCLSEWLAPAEPACCDPHSSAPTPASSNRPAAMLSANRASIGRAQELILYLGLGPLPLLERSERLLAHCGRHRNLARLKRQRKLIVNERVVESSSCRVGARAGVVHFVETCPINGAHAHGTRLAGSVQFAASERKIAKSLARRTDDDNLGVRGGIERARDLINPGGENEVILHHQRSKRAAPG